MERTLTPTFKNPTVIQRLKSMLGVDFYRLFHTPLYFIMIAISAIIPAMILTMGGDGAAMYSNTWNIIAADTPLYVISDIGEYANMNMVFIFGGIMVSIFIGHDYRSGYVKQLFTTHAKKRDYMISKSITCAFGMASMCVTYLFGSVLAGVIVGADFSVNIGSLLCALLGKMIMSLGWASLYTFLNVILRRHFGVAIALSFFIGTGMPIIGAAALLVNNEILNVFLYGSSVYACLGSTFGSLVVCAVVSCVWTLIYNTVGSTILALSDVY